MTSTKSNSIYQFSVEDIHGKTISLDQYKGKVLLIVNTASECGFTKQYEGLEELWQQFKDEGLVVLGFPCNQFGEQEPGSSESILNFCQVNFGVSFPMFKKIEVNGKNAHPLFQYLKNEAAGLLGTQKIKWNFTKFLIDSEGQVFKRFGSFTKPSIISKKVKSLL